MDPDVFWGGLLVAGAAFETYALINSRDGYTLSETTRKLFRVRTRVGRLVFGVAWCAFATWFLFHIVNQ